MNAKKKQSKPWLWALLPLLIIVPLLVLLVIRMEGRLPTMELKMDGAAIGAEHTLSVAVADEQSGIRQVWVAILKDGKETVLADKQFQGDSLFSGGAVHAETVDVEIDTHALGLSDGPAVLRLMTRDYSWRHWGDGNRQYQEQEVVIDTRAPMIQIVSHPLNLNQGGGGVVVYRLSEACRSSGIMVGDNFYPGDKGAFSDANLYMTFIALNHRQGASTRLYATATDFAGNKGRAGIARHINVRRFKKDTIRLSDSFLSWKMPELQDQVEIQSNPSLLELFLKVNRDLRKANYEVFKRITAQRDAKLYWQGAFQRLPGAANRAGFADFRTYLYKGKSVDQQTHLGIDLASLPQSPIPAANAGKVAFAENLGIYGLAIVIDHGFGLFTVYGHLSQIDVSIGQMVDKGETIGKTGKTGLAGGDHLHFGVLVHHTFVNPLEWWDPQWVRNNISSKLESVQ